MPSCGRSRPALRSSPSRCQSDRCPDDAGEACQVPRMAEEDSPEDRASGVSDEEEFPSEEVGKGMSADGGAAGTEV